MGAKQVAQTLTIFFDGHCNFCSEWVNFVSRHDPLRRFRFRALQSEEGRIRLARESLSPDYLDSLVLATEDRVWFKSDAALIIFRELGWPWRVLSLFRFLPVAIRDWMYDCVAAVRYRLFGRREVCRLS